MKNHKQLAQWLILITAIFLPFFVIRFFPNFYHSSDMDDFWRWSQAWRTDWKSIYVNCERCNYPFVGTLLSGGVMSALKIESFAQLANRFRYVLALFDAMNILLILFILQKMQVKNAPFWSGVIGLLPSSWLGSSVWGQIDGIGQSLILLFFILLIWFYQKERSTVQFYLFSAITGLLFSLMILTKQLIYFSVFSFGLIFLTAMFAFSRRFAFILSSGLIALTSFILPIFIIDLNLVLKEPYFSHLQYILATGSSHGDIIAATGFNIWVFLAETPVSSSYSPIPIQIGSTTLFSLTPYFWGLALFLLVNAFLLIIFARQFYNLSIKGLGTGSVDLVMISFIWFALVNLSFNLVLTGTHERYLYHFYPFVIVACLAYMERNEYFNRFTLIILLTGAVVYGAFLYGYLTLLVRPVNPVPLQWMSVFHTSLFFYIVAITMKQFKLQRTIYNL